MEGSNLVFVESNNFLGAWQYPKAILKIVPAPSGSPSGLLRCRKSLARMSTRGSRDILVRNPTLSLVISNTETPDWLSSETKLRLIVSKLKQIQIAFKNKVGCLHSQIRVDSFRVMKRFLLPKH